MTYISKNNVKTSKYNQNPHKFHRERLRTRFVENGIDSFHEHEILEMLLFYSIPVANTNPLAHKLLSQFGSLKNVFEAPMEALARVDGMGEKSALFISFVNKIFLRLSEITPQEMVFSDYDTVGQFLVNEFKYDKKERVIALLLDAKFRLISKEKVGNGDFKSCDIDTRTLLTNVLNKNAAKVILAHNHVDGNPFPSINDKVATTSLISLLNQVGIELTEHYIICDDKYAGIKKMWN